MTEGSAGASETDSRKWVTREMVQQYEHWLIFQSQIWFPANTQQFTTLTLVPRGYVIFWPPRVLYASGAHINERKTPPHTQS